MAVDLRGAIRLDNAFTPALESISSMIETVTMSARNLKPAVDNAFSSRGVSQMTANTKKLKEGIDNVRPPTRKNRDEQRRHNEEIGKGANAARGLASTLKSVLGIYTLIRGAKAFVQTSDDLMSVTSRLGMMNDGLQSTNELNQMIFDSAQRSRGSYLDTANAVASLGQQTEGLFETNKELITFSEVLNKQFAIGQTPLAAQQSAMLQLTQALGSGVLRGDEFNSIFEAAPQLIKLIANELGVPVGMMRTMAANGEISAEVVKNALLNAVDETNKAFESMPKTFRQMIQSFKNESVMALAPAMQQWNKILNSPAVQGMFDAAIAGVRRFGDAILYAGILMEDFINWAADNWNWLGAVVMAVGFAMGAVMTVAMAKATKAAVMAIASWVAVNWQILLVGAGIGLIIWALGQMGVTFSDVFGFTMGLVFTLGAILQNLAIGIYNGAMATAEGVVYSIDMIKYYFDLGVWHIQRGWASMTYGMKSTFVSFGNSIIGFFNGVVNKIIDGLNWIIDKANAVGSLLPERFGGFHIQRFEHVQTGRLEMPEGPDFDALRPEAPERPDYGRKEYKSLTDAFNAGQDFGGSLLDAVGDRIKDVKDKLGNAMDLDIERPGSPGAIDSFDPESGKALKDTAKNTKSMDNQLKRTNSDLNTLKDIMTARAITNISWDKIDVHVENSFGDVHNTADLDGWIGSLQEGLQEAIDSSMTGVVVLE